MKHVVRFDSRLQSRLQAGIFFLLFTLSLAALPMVVRRAQGQSSISIVSAASFESGAVAPDNIVSIFGTALATRVEAASTQPLPTTLAGTSVKFKDAAGKEVLAPLIFVSPSQINCVTPAAMASGTAMVTVSSGDGITSTGAVRIAQVAPGIFTANASGSGVAAANTLRITSAGQQTFESVFMFDPQNRAVHKPIDLNPEGNRVFLLVFCTGVRNAPDPNSDGNANESVRVILGGSEVTPFYAGIAPGFAGLDQVNVELPRALIGRGVVSFALTVGGVTSNSATIEIAPPPNAATPPRVTNFGPNPALAGGMLNIDGLNFDPAKDKNLILVAGNESRAVEQASETQLRVRVPFGAASGKLAVRTAQGQGEGAANLNLRTSISGYVETTAGQPLSGMAVRVLGTSPPVSAVTDNEGAFVLADVPAAASQNVEVAPPVSPTPLLLQSVIFKLRVTPNQDNHAGRIALQPIQPTGQNALPFGSTGTPAPSTLAERTSPGQAAQTRLIQDNGVMFEITDNAAAMFPGNVTSGTIFLNLVERSRTPVELPPGVFSSTIAQLTPFRTRLTPGGKLSFPNADRLPITSSPRLYRLDQAPGSQTLGTFVDAGAAFVTTDGARVETAANAVTETSMFFVAVPQPVTTVIGRVVENDGTTPVRNAIARANGQEATTDGNGGFTLRNVSVSAATILVEASVQRPNGRVDRAQNSAVPVVLNGTTNAGNLILPPLPPIRLPVIFAPMSLEVTEGLTVNATVLAYDQDTNAQGMNQSVQTSLVSPPAFAALTAAGGNAYTLRLTPRTGDARTYTLTITATDDANATATQTIRVTVNANRAPSLTAPALRSTPQGQALSFTIAATDLDNTSPGLATPQSFTFASPNLPPGATLTPLADGMSARFDWTPTVAGNFTPAFTATDNGTPPQTSPSRSTTVIVVAPWMPTGSAAGRIEAAQAFALLSSGANLFVATSGGVFFSANQGQVWTSRNNGLSTPHTNALAFNGATLLAGTNGGGVFHSPDNGQNWETCGNLPNGVVRALLVTAQGLFAGTGGGGVFRSADGCRNWTAVNNGLTNPGINALAAVGSTLYAGTEGGGVFGSSDNGQSWQPVNAGLANAKVRALAVAGTTLLAGTDGGGAFCSGNPAQGWTSCNNGLSNPTINSLTVNAAEVFACTSGDGVFRSTDQGANWVPLKLDGLKNPFVSSFAVGGNTYFAGTAGGGVFTSGNQGQSWTAVNSGLGTSTVNALTANGTTLYAGTAGGGVFSSNDQGQTWKADGEGLTAPFVNTFVIAGSRLFASTNGGVFSSPLTSPLNWTANNTGLPGERYAIPLIVAGASLYTGIAPAGGVYRSDDLGQTWRAANSGLSELNIQSLTASGSTLLAGTENSGVFRSTNGGQSWTAANSGLTNSRVHALVVNGATIYAGTGNGIHRSTDQGQSWLAINTGLPDQAFVNTLLINGSTLYAGVFGGVFLSRDQGQNWAAVNNGLTYNNVFSLFAGGSNLFAGTIGGGVYLNFGLGTQ